jgi:hypothetical protein
MIFLTNDFCREQLPTNAAAISFKTFGCATRLGAACRLMWLRGCHQMFPDGSTTTVDVQLIQGWGYRQQQT